QLPAAAAPVEDIPLSPPVIALADRLGVDLEHQRAYFFSDIARLLYTNADSRPPVFTAPPPDPNAPPILVPLPLPAALWSRAVFRHAIPPGQLIATILADRRATLLGRGFSGLDDETLNYFIDHPQLVSYLYEHAAPQFAAFGDVLRIHQGKIVPPGGPKAVA